VSSTHPHAHAHGHGPRATPQTFDRAFAIGIALNLAYVGVEAYWGLKIGSLALLADAGHNLSDVAGLVLAWAGALAGRLRPDAHHTYGWPRASSLAAFVNAVLLLVAMGALAWEAVQRLAAPVPLEGWTIVAVAAVGIVVNTATALLFLRGREHDLNVRGAFLHMAADALVSAGVVVAGALTLAFAWTWVDPVASLVIAAVIVAGTWGLLRQSLHLLFDGVPAHVDLHEVEHELAALPGVAQVSDLHVWAIGTTRTVLTAHLVVPGEAPGDDFYRGASQRLHERFGIEHVTLQVTRTPAAFACAGGPRVADDGKKP